MTEVLFADDHAEMRAMVSDVLRAAGFAVRLAPSGRAALEELWRAPPDLAVLDYRMGDLDGFAVCTAIKGNPGLEHIPVLIVTGEGQVDHRVRAFDAGADDFLAKPFDPRELVARCRALLRLARQGLDRNPTTHLPGGEALHREVERRSALGEPFSLCYLDLDHFKPFSDRFGFAVADDAIREAAHALREAVLRSDSFVGHVGGDDFILIAAPAVARLQVEEAQARFRSALAGHLPAEIAATGRYRAKDREGVDRDLPLTRLSAAILHLDADQGLSLKELSPLIADAKLAAKRSAIGVVETSLPEGASNPSPGRMDD